MPTKQFTPEAIANVASNLLQIPVNLVNHLSFTGACRQARLLLIAAESVAAEPLSEAPEPRTRAEQPPPRRAAYPSDICPVAKIEAE